MHWGRLLTLFAVCAVSGCATAEDNAVLVTYDTGLVRADSAQSLEDSESADSTMPDTVMTDDTTSPPDTAVVDTAIPDAAVADSATPDTVVADSAMPDTSVADTAMADTAVTDGGDSGVTLGKVLIFDDGAGSLASAAASALGGTPTLATTGPAFNTAYDAGGVNIVVIDCALDYLPAGVKTRVTTWAATGRLVIAYWDLNSETALRTALRLSTVTTYSAFKPIYNDPTSTVNLFAFKLSVPSPQTRTGVPELADNGDSLTVAAGGFLAARHDSATGTGAIAVTNGGKIVINGFAPYNIRTNDLDTDGVMDMQELYANELAYVSTK